MIQRCNFEVRKVRPCALGSEQLLCPNLRLNGAQDTLNTRETCNENLTRVFIPSFISHHPLSSSPRPPQPYTSTSFYLPGHCGLPPISMPSSQTAPPRGTFLWRLRAPASHFCRKVSLSSQSWGRRASPVFSHRLVHTFICTHFKRVWSIKYFNYVYILCIGICR